MRASFLLLASVLLSVPAAAEDLPRLDGAEPDGRSRVSVRCREIPGSGSRRAACATEWHLPGTWSSFEDTMTRREDGSWSRTVRGECGTTVITLWRREPGGTWRLRETFAPRTDAPRSPVFPCPGSVSRREWE